MESRNRLGRRCGESLLVALQDAYKKMKEEV
jgi:hypothetical protein